MTLYFYDKKKHHKSSDTDRLIAESIRRYDSTCGEIEVMRTKFGKPYVNLPFHVGVTHTNDIIIVGIDSENFGIDCERIGRTIPNYERIAERYFTENELCIINKSVDKNKAFLDIWVKKEAYVKFTGLGLSGMKNCDVTLLSGFEKTENDRNLIIYVYKENNNE